MTRALGHLRLEQWKAAEAAATRALALDPTHAKARLRRAKASSQLGKVGDTLRDIRALGDAGVAPPKDLVPIVQRVKDAKARKERTLKGAFQKGGLDLAPAPAPEARPAAKPAAVPRRPGVSGF